MTYIPQSESERQEMLASIGVKNFSELLEGIPKETLLQHPLHLPEKLSEFETINLLSDLAAKNNSGQDYLNFMGSGAYDHIIPTIVSHLISRSEFMTAYTPYQAEVSQGTLQTIYEYQSLICRLTGMPVSNASLYDGASAVAEAVILAVNHTRKSKVLISALLHPHYRAVLTSYLSGIDIEFVTVEHNDGIVNTDDLKEKIPNSACFILQNPNFYGIIEPTDSIPEIVHNASALLIAAVNPVSLAYLKTPAEYETDICVGEGQPMGNALNFGGPYFGFLAAQQKYIRKIPGRIAAMTEDIKGKRAFCLTLQTREQHIRRDKATSNICTNQALCALAGAIHLVTLGKEGLKELAKLCINKSHYLQEKLCAVEGIELAHDKKFFMEFAIKTPLPARKLYDKLLNKKIFAGVPTSRFLWDDDYLIVCATEKRTKKEIDYFVTAMLEVVAKDTVLPKVS